MLFARRLASGNVIPSEVPRISYFPDCCGRGTKSRDLSWLLGLQHRNEPPAEEAMNGNNENYGSD